MKLLAVALLAFSALAGAQATTATVGTPFSFQLAPASAFGYATTTNGAQNTLPPGLVYVNSTGILSGTPKTAGTYNILLQQSTATPGIYVPTTISLVVNAAGAPAPPAALFCAGSTKPNCGTNLSWTAPASTKDTIAGYLVFRATGSSSTFTQLTPAKITALTYVDASVAPSTSYSYYILSVDTAGALSVPSNTATVTVPAVVVTASLVPDPPTGLTATLVMTDGSTFSN